MKRLFCSLEYQYFLRPSTPRLQYAYFFLLSCLSSTVLLYAVCLLVVPLLRLEEYLLLFNLWIMVCSDALGFSSVTTDWHVPTLPAVLGRGIRADPKFFGEVGEMKEGLGQQTYIEKHLTAANCLYISGFWGLRPADPHRGSVPGSRFGTSIPQSPCAHPYFRAWLRHCFAG